VRTDAVQTVVLLEARGPRARLRAEAQAGLNGLPMTEGLPGQWVQAYYLHALVSDAGGRLESIFGDDLVTVSAILPVRAS
jgi:histidine phosphotransferase ChpT